MTLRIQKFTSQVANIPRHDLGALLPFKEPHGPHAVDDAVTAVLSCGVRFGVAAAVALYRTLRRIAAAVAARRIERQACFGPSGWVRG